MKKLSLTKLPCPVRLLAKPRQLPDGSVRHFGWGFEDTAPGSEVDCVTIAQPGVLDY
jgi:hypothetical protein